MTTKQEAFKLLIKPQGLWKNICTNCMPYEYYWQVRDDGGFFDLTFIA
ncbi:hypothetical protein HY486_01715 [Candidatus Woesearchaeota archaeon]|nr:hypothetical protein [Candidatus Woesearchaeota archaeon]